MFKQKTKLPHKCKKHNNLINEDLKITKLRENLKISKIKLGNEANNKNNYQECIDTYFFI